MKRLIATALAFSLLAPFSGKYEKKTAEAEELAACKAAYVCDCGSGICAYAQNETERLPIASMCKIMTLLLSFEAADGGALSYDEMITVGDNASGMGGSQVFLGSNLSYPARELMKSVAVCSANDSCVALAERIAGSEEAFVEKMNARARELGAENTLFANCTGLPREPQYSCAKDVSVMLRELLKHPKYFEFSRIWLEDFSHPDGRTTRITNTNKLIRFYEGCDGGKTGFTNQAGFCLAATAKRNEMRLISVVIGAESSDARFTGVKNLFNFAFANYENRKIVEANHPLDEKLPVKGCKNREISVCAERDLCVFAKKGETAETTCETVLESGLKAPFEAGAEVGEIILYCNGVERDRCKLVAAESAERLSWSDAYREIAREWN